MSKELNKEFTEWEQAVYYALVNVNKIRMDKDTGQLEIYENREDAVNNIEFGVSLVTEVIIQRKEIDEDTDNRSE